MSKPVYTLKLCLVIGLLLIPTFATASETGILESNLDRWKALSFWCESTRDYPCWEFYNTFAKTAQREGIPFIYIEKKGTVESLNNVEKGYFPISLFTQPSGPNMGVKIVIEYQEAGQRKRLYEKSKHLKITSPSYSEDLITFYKHEAKAINNDLKRFSKDIIYDPNLNIQEDEQIENMGTSAKSYLESFINKAGAWVDDLQGYSEPSPEAIELSKKTERSEQKEKEYIRSFILRKWTPPVLDSEAQKQTLKTKVLLNYSTKGILTLFEITEPSQNNEFNQSIKDAVTKSSKLPGAIPQELNMEILFNYTEMMKSE